MKKRSCLAAVLSLSMLLGALPLQVAAAPDPGGGTQENETTDSAIFDYSGYNKGVTVEADPESPTGYTATFVYDEEDSYSGLNGDITKVELYSDCMYLFKYDEQTAGDQRGLAVYLPYGYDADRAEPYKILYLSHGASGDQTGNELRWMNEGAVANIMDNLAAEDKIEPYVVVTMNNQDLGWDFGLSSVTEYSNVLTELGIEHDHLQVPGAHDWETWQLIYAYAAETFFWKADSTIPGTDTPGAVNPMVHRSTFLLFPNSRPPMVGGHKKVILLFAGTAWLRSCRFLFHQLIHGDKSHKVIGNADILPACLACL